MLTAIPRHWRFESDGTASPPRVLTVHALTPREANESVHGLKSQVEELLRHLHASVGGSPARAAAATESHFAVTPSANPPDVDDKNQETIERNLLLFVCASGGNEELELHPTKITGFARVYEEPELKVIICSSFGVQSGVSQSKEQEVLRALFHATQGVGEAFAQSIHLQRAQKVEQAVSTATSSKSSVSLWRGTFDASEYLKQYLKDQGFSGDSFDRLEMTKFLVPDDKLLAGENEPISFPEGIIVKPLDLQQDNLVKVYDVLKMAFGGNPPSFKAWKIHYPQQPRFAPKLSFVAWDDGNEPVSVALIERVVEGEGEGGGDDEVARIYATHGGLPKEAMSDKDSDRTLKFPSDFDARKNRIEATVLEACVCGVATKASHRGKGIAADLLRMSFEAAEKSTVLEKVTLGTDRFNASAVRAYLRAGLVETKSENPGRIVAKDIYLRKP